MLAPRAPSGITRADATRRCSNREQFRFSEFPEPTENAVTQCHSSHSPTAADRTPRVIPSEALKERLALAAAIESARPVPCQASDAEAWWPDRREVDEPPARDGARWVWRLRGARAVPGVRPGRRRAGGHLGGLLPAQRRLRTGRVVLRVN